MEFREDFWSWGARQEDLNESYNRGKPYCQWGRVGACCRQCLIGPCQLRQQDIAVCGKRWEDVLYSSYVEQLARAFAMIGEHEMAGKMLEHSLRRGTLNKVLELVNNWMKRVADSNNEVNGDTTPYLWLVDCSSVRVSAGKIAQEFANKAAELNVVTERVRCLECGSALRKFAMIGSGKVAIPEALCPVSILWFTCGIVKGVKVVINPPFDGIFLFSNLYKWGKKALYNFENWLLDEESI